MPIIDIIIRITIITRLIWTCIKKNVFVCNNFVAGSIQPDDLRCQTKVTN